MVVVDQNYEITNANFSLLRLRVNDDYIQNIDLIFY